VAYHDRVRIIVLFLAPLLALGAADSGDFPQTVISNGQVTAKLYLPDAQKGYYRATRFDWSGVIPSLEYKGHSYFGKWFDRYDAKIHDAIMGPVEEFLTDGVDLGYAEAKPGDTFVKIGVGVLRKPDEPQFKQFETYEIVDNGAWTVTPRPDSVTFNQSLRDPNSGYAYSYTKVVRLTPGKPELVLEHTLRNTGSKAIDSDVYEHNFYMLDGQPSGPNITVRFPFEVKAAADLDDKAVTRGKDLVYLRELQRRESVFSELRGYGLETSDNDIRVENSKTGAGVREIGSRPLSKLVYWSIRSTACPEAYVHISVAPGKETTWKITYQFYEISH
jgi:hypothetical protein